MSSASLSGIVSYCGPLAGDDTRPRLRRRGERLAGGEHRTGDAHRGVGGREPGNRQARRECRGGPAHRASRAVLVEEPPVDGQAARVAAAADRKQSGGIQFAPAIGRSSPAGQQRAIVPGSGVQAFEALLLRKGRDSSGSKRRQASHAKKCNAGSTVFWAELRGCCRAGLQCAAGSAWLRAAPARS